MRRIRVSLRHRSANAITNEIKVYIWSALVYCIFRLFSLKTCFYWQLLNLVKRLNIIFFF